MHMPGGARRGQWGFLTWLLTAVTLAGGGCSQVLDPDVLDVQPVPDLPMASAPLQVKGALKDAAVMQGKDGAPWVAVKVADGAAVVLQQLAAPFARQLLPVDKVAFPAAPAQSICTVVKQPIDGSYLVGLRRPGDDSVVTAQLLGSPVLLCGQRTVATYATGIDPTYIEVVRRRTSGEVVRLRLPWPHAANPDWDQGPRGFDENEQVLVTIDGDYRTLLYYLDSNVRVDLGPVYLGGPAAGHYIYVDYDGFVHAYVIAEQRALDLGFRLSPDGQLMGFDVDNLAVLTCDWDGVRAIAIQPARSGSPVVATQRLLDPEPCHAEYSTLASRTKSLVYNHGADLRAVPLDGSSPPRLLNRQGSQQIFNICQDQAVAYSLDPPERYGKGVGDGWVGSFRFMERGRDARFAPDCQRLRFKEHAASLRKLGELRSQVLSPGGWWDTAPMLRLARNVGFYQEQPDGRLLVADNLAVIGDQDRVSLIDEDQRTTRELLHGVGTLTGALPLGTYFPGVSDLLLEVDTPELDNLRYLIYLPIPPLKPAS